MWLGLRGDEAPLFHISHRPPEFNFNVRGGCILRVAAIYDIHGNLPALEAVLQEIRAIGVDLLVVGGDVLPGPMPVETLGRLLNLKTPVKFIRGNGEAAVVDELAGRESSTLHEQVRAGIRWTAQQLSLEHERMIESWPATIRSEIGGLGEVLFCHATPRSDTELFTRLTPEERLLPVFDGINVPLVICGHTHMQFDRMVGTIRVVNAGSVGMPFGLPRADWLLLGPDVELRHTAFDLAQAAECIRKTEYPQAEDFAARNVLQPPSEEEMLKIFTRAELKG